MKLNQTAIPDVIWIEPQIHRDDRGWFMESFNAPRFHQALQRLNLPVPDPFVQDNHSCSKKGVLRGLHYQRAPFEQGKLIRVVRGSAFDVAVDIREDSPTYGQYVSMVLSAENQKILWIPPGFAHGFVALEDNTEFLYKTTNIYSKEHEEAIRWNDPALNINWPLKENLIINQKDNRAKTLPSRSSKTAILLTVYNGMQYLQPQIQSILNQTQIDLTVYVSIDPSTDGSEAWMRQLAETDPRIILLPTTEKFGGAARNFFRLIRDVDFTPFDYIAFADQDDLWYPDKLHKAVTTLTRSGYDAFSSDVTAFWPDGKRKTVHKSQPQKQWDFIFQSAGPGCTYVMTRNLMQAMKDHMATVWEDLQEVEMHDWFCYAFARARGYRWFIDPKPGMLYRQHERNQLGANIGLKACMQRFKKIRDGSWMKQTRMIAELVGLADHAFLKPWIRRSSRMGLLGLALKAHQCRRVRRDQIAFFIVCLVLALNPFTGSL